VREQLRDICGVRAGDKGDISDLTLFADTVESYDLLRREVTVDAVAAHFGPAVTGPITRYEAPNVLALKFVLRGALGGGGPLTLRSDNLGKTLGGALLRMRIEVPEGVLADLPRSGRTPPAEPVSASGARDGSNS
jgi:hypothetical protein